MANDSLPPVLRPAQQIEILESLSQQAAAWLIGVSARALRDLADAPRHVDGTYNARELAAWASKHSTLRVLRSTTLPGTDIADLLDGHANTTGPESDS